MSRKGRETWGTRLVWFRRDGRRYQTRINAALRKVMERETKEAGE
jgi:BrnA antitoxin of type II toxin-antitoxin system